MFQPISPTNLEGFQGLIDARTKIFNTLTTTLGTYTTTTESIPALWVVKNLDTDPPRHYTKQGLECLIFPPEIIAQPLHHNAIATELWRIRLIQNDRTKSTTAGYLALLTAFPDCQKESRLLADRDIDEQLNLLILNPLIVNG
jgi:hypothetical protein